MSHFQDVTQLKCQFKAQMEAKLWVFVSYSLKKNYTNLALFISFVKKVGFGSKNENNKRFL